MIESSQLRIGNWLHTVDGSYGTVKSLGSSILIETFTGIFLYTFEKLFPISVDTHILSICGFQLSNASYLHKDFNLCLKCYDDGKWHLIHAEVTVHEFEYLHELQNMYFDVTGCSLDPNLIGIWYFFPGYPQCSSNYKRPAVLSLQLRTCILYIQANRNR